VYLVFAIGTVKSIVERLLGHDCVKQQWYSKLSKSEKEQIQANTMKATQVAELNKRLSAVRFPDGVLRTMPQLSPHVGLKAMEYELILFYGWPLFDGLIEVNRFRNFRRLAFILSTLSMKYVGMLQEMRHAEAQVGKFMEEFSRCYSSHEAFMLKMNVHLISHLCQMVRLYGPLPVQSAYYCENSMGIIGSRV
jgi:hypothetical protein